LPTLSIFFDYSHFVQGVKTGRLPRYRLEWNPTIADPREAMKTIANSTAPIILISLSLLAYISQQVVGSNVR
jgi:hypothetical protein